MRKIEHDEILNNFIYEYDLLWWLRIELWLRVNSNVLQSCACGECLWFDKLEERELENFILIVDWYGLVE